MGIKRINPDLCKPNCGLCVEECPLDIILIDKKTGKAVVCYPEDCHNCSEHFFCEKICPVPGAVEVTPDLTLVVSPVW
jgi:NAD-dependent dihydropyrimidine dehydrogenase PreA subunit